jgi:hypothetical protein
MNYSIKTADRATHLRILLTTAIAVVIGISLVLAGSPVSVKQPMGEPMQIAALAVSR